MTLAEKIELVLVLLFLISLALLFKSPTIETKLSFVVLYCASLLFLQSLIRDVWYLFAQRKRADTQAVARQCMCVESCIGLLILVVGVLLFSSTIDYVISISKVALLVLVSVILVSGYIAKDYVIEWRPWRIYKDIDHMNIIFSWKKK